MAQTKREQHWPGGHTGVGRVELSQGETAKLAYSASSSVHQYVDIPLGASLIAFYKGALSAGASFKFQVAISASGTYRLVRKTDDTGDLGITSGSTLRAVFLPDLAPFRFIKAVQNKSLASKKVFGWIVKG